MVAGGTTSGFQEYQLTDNNKEHPMYIVRNEQPSQSQLDKKSRRELVTELVMLFGALMAIFGVMVYIQSKDDD